MSEKLVSKFTAVVSNKDGKIYQLNFIMVGGRIYQPNFVMVWGWEYTNKIL
jgi:hypothetical protein